MSVQRTLQKYMDDWKRISHLDFCLLLEDNSVFVATCEKRLPSTAKLDEFRQSTALCLANTTYCLYKVTEKSDVLWLSARFKAFWKVFPKKMTRTLLCRNCFWETIQK